MRLYRTLLKEVKWIRAFSIYMPINLLIIVVAILEYGSPTTFVITLIALALFQFLSINIIMSIFAFYIHYYMKRKHPLHYSGMWPFDWLFFSYTETNICVKFNSKLGQQLRSWCDLNCNGEWKHCGHGYFAFKDKADLIHFKLMWLGND